MPIVAGPSADFRKSDEEFDSPSIRPPRSPRPRTHSGPKGGGMNLVKSTPWRELKAIQAYLNRAFDDTPLRRIEDEDLFVSEWAPPVDVGETDKEYLIKAELPEIKKEDLKVE